ncbi:hypothetical protein QYF61_007335 [Mycteria americana]|uniref:Uncharacterized protein n=1 Tax=Mycteria americana TaxID=33587 RepID=A0AAN7MJ90_MYCAM|nr:hypothetical protein QYF61_007335 [Mycteria americana]
MVFGSVRMSTEAGRAVTASGPHCVIDRTLSDLGEADCLPQEPSGTELSDLGLAKIGRRINHAKKPQFPQPLLIRLVLLTLHQLHCPSLDTLQHLNVFLVVRGPKLNTVVKVRPHQCRVQRDDHFPSPAGRTISDTSQDAIGLLGHLGTLLAHIQAAVNQHPQVLPCWAAFQPLFPRPVALHGVVVKQVQDPALSLVEPHTIDLGPSIQPVQVPLQSLPPLKQINTPAQLGVICKFTEGALDPLICRSGRRTRSNDESQYEYGRPRLFRLLNRETQITAMCWGLAHAYRALFNTIQYPQGEKKVSGSGDKTTGTVATPSPATGTASEPGNQPMSVSVAPIYKKKSWKRKSARLERED